MTIDSGRTLTIQEQQEVMLGIMKAIHTFCVDNDIRYVLLFGTLLGAVRHKGFIPWDNDMDIGIPRPDYDKLVTLLNSGKTIGEHFYHLHYTNDDNYHYQIMDGVPRKTPLGILRRARLFVNKKLQIADIYSVRDKKDFANRAGNLICKIFPNAKKRNYKIDSILRKTPFDTSEFVGDMEDRDEKIFSFEKSFFEEYVLLDFEDAKFFCPAKWDEYLKKAYGDYMKLPPEGKRMTHPTGCKWC